MREARWRLAWSESSPQVSGHTFHTTKMASSLRALPVHGVAERSCFVKLPLALMQAVHQDESTPEMPLVLQLSRDENQDKESNVEEDKKAHKHMYVSWSGAASASQGVEMANEMMAALGLEEGEKVQLRACRGVPKAKSLELEPAHADDWEVLESNQEYLEEQLLNQVHVLQKGQEFPFWVRNNRPIQLRVAGAKPSNVCCAVDGTELLVAPCSRKGHEINGDAAADLGALPDTQGKPAWLRVLPVGENRAAEVLGASKSKLHCSAKNAVLTIHPQTADRYEFRKGQTVYILRQDGKDGQNDQKKSYQAYFQIDISKTVPVEHVLMMESTMAYIGMNLPTRVTLYPTPVEREPIETLGRVMLTPLIFEDVGSSPEANDFCDSLSTGGFAADRLKEWIKANRVAAMTLLDDNSQISFFLRERGGDLVDEVRMVVNLLPKPSGRSFVMIDKLPESTNVIVGRESYVPKLVRPFRMWEGVEEEEDQWLQSLADDVMEQLEWHLNPDRVEELCRLDAPPPGHVLLHGAEGCGKSSFVLSIMKRLSEAVVPVHTVFVDCVELSEKVPETQRAMFAEMVHEAIACAPSLIILEDIEEIVPEITDDAMLQMQMQEGGLPMLPLLNTLLEQAGEEAQAGRPIAIMATSCTVDAIDASLLIPGKLDYHVGFPQPSLSERKSIIVNKLESYGCTFDSKALDSVAEEAEGYDASDLTILAERAIHAGYTRAYSLSSAAGSPLCVTEKDFEVALEGFVPAIMQRMGKMSLKQKKDEEAGWNLVGGMHAATSSLQEILELPSKFPELVSQAPLRLPTGVLLYGPPGCGKTHVVSAAISATGLRSVVVKGPELLNKYIGASEAAVRDAFQRARSAAPCLLFFDEFDAIAPRRGHDNTGVTDRVVNQLLTELDGVEALTGVFVVGATNRPDLIDPALLRPGRLDQLIYCGFPSAAERKEILEALLADVPMATDINLADIAESTEGFSGADLQGLLADTQLNAVHEYMEMPEETRPAEGILLSARHMYSALGRTRPSISSQERERLEGIYGNFVSSRTMGLGTSYKAKGKMVSYA